MSDSQCSPGHTKTLVVVDFCEERDAIISRVVPRIREEAKQKYGFEFHVSVNLIC